MMTQISHDIIVSVESEFLEDESLPDENHYVWVYHIHIENDSEVSVQLKSRLWRITDRHGITNEFVGEGVVGEQPFLSPGDVFEYSSTVPLNTPSGIMAGEYKMITEKGDPLTVEIPIFSLDSPFDNSLSH